MYEHQLEDVDRKFNNQVCLLQTDKLPKNFYFLVREAGAGGYTIWNKQGDIAQTNVDWKKIKFTYHRFISGYYPTTAGYGYTVITRSLENKVFTQGLGRNSFRFGGDHADAFEFFRDLRGTFTEPLWHTNLKSSGAFSRLYKKAGSKFISIFGINVGSYDHGTNEIYLSPDTEQEFIDLLKRNNNYGAIRVNKR